MKLDNLFEKFLSLFKKEENETPEAKNDDVYKEERVTSNLRRSRGDRKKAGQVGPIRKFWRRYHLTKIVLILGLSASLFVGV